MDSEPNSIQTYAYDKQITSTDQLPVPQDERTCTDLFCTIFTIIIGLGILIAAIAMFKIQKLMQITYPTDGDGKKCTQDHPQHNYLYFTSFSDPSKRLCVSECPKGTENELNCYPTKTLGCAKNTNSEFEVQIYQTQPQQTSLGLYCMPTDKELKDKLLRNANLLVKYTFINSFRAIWISIGISFALGVLYLLMMCCAPGFTTYLAIILGGLSCLLTGILLIVENNKFIVDQRAIIFIFAVILIFFGFFCLYSLLCYRQDLTLCVSFLQNGIKILIQQMGLIFLIPIFFVLFALLLALFGFQIFSIWSNSQITFDERQVYYQTGGSFAQVATIVNVIQLVWGLCFIKQAFNFLVSGCAITHYYWKDSRFMFGLTNLFRFHWGSVVAGSFILNFFYLFDVIYDALKPDENNRGCYKSFVSICCLCDRVLGLARGQAHAFINLVGLPYCNSARWCERLNFLTNFFNGSQSIFRFFKVGSHVMLSTLATLFSFFYSLSSIGDANAPVLLFSFIVNIFTVTFFVSLPADLGESLLVCKLVEKYLNNEEMHEDLRQEERDEKRIHESNVNQGYDVYPTSPN